MEEEDIEIQSGMMKVFFRRVEGRFCTVRGKWLLPGLPHSVELGPGVLLMANTAERIPLKYGKNNGRGGDKTQNMHMERKYRGR